MNTIYPAHIHPETGMVQTCTAHCRQTAAYAAAALTDVGLSSCGYYAGLLHDMGKFKDEFKQYIESGHQKRGSVIHSFAGVRYLLEKHTTEFASMHMEDLVYEILAYAIGAHHGLFDCIDESHQNGYLHRLQTPVAGDDEAIAHFHEQCAGEEETDRLFEKAAKELAPFMEGCWDLTASNSENAQIRNSENQFLFGMAVRLLTSAVMEGDRRDTAEFMTGAAFPAPANGELWTELLNKVEERLQAFPQDTPIAEARHYFSDACRKAADLPSGVYRLNIPTGGGKTLSSLRYALAHAAKHNKKRIIFTFPLLSILEQNSKVIRQALQAEDNDDLVCEHHSNVLLERDTGEELDRYELLTDSWSSPIIITTLVQLLNTLFDGKTSCVRRFHALTNAVLVIDEVQTVPTKLLSLFHTAISFLAGLCHTTVILCSATQPYTEKLTHPILTETPVLIEYGDDIRDVFRRTDIQSAGDFRLDELPAFAERVLETTESLLIVCNKKAESEALYQAFDNRSYARFHLSAAMCVEHRKKTLRDLYASLSQKDKKTVCVATQVIEAGVDISFGAVIRVTAGLDSILQAAGRCNRNGEAGTLGKVYIVHLLNEDLQYLKDIKQGQDAIVSLLSKPEESQNDLSSDASIRAYYEKLYNSQTDEDRSKHDYSLPFLSTTLYELLSQNTQFQSEANALQPYFFHQAFATAGRAFEVFDTATTDVLVPWEKGKELILALNSEEARRDAVYARELIRQARGYTVSLYSYQKAALEKEQALYPVADGAILALAEGYYHPQTGFTTVHTKEESNPCATLIW